MVWGQLLCGLVGRTLCCNVKVMRSTLTKITSFFGDKYCMNADNIKVEPHTDNYENLLTIIKTTIIYGTIITCALLCTVHESKSQRNVQIFGVSSPPSHCTGYRARSSQEEQTHS